MSVAQKLDSLEEKGFIYWPPHGRIPRYKRYLKDSGGNPIQDVISDIPPLSVASAERLGYPTQKPIALLERIIAASSNEGDVVLDPFCGCGTAVHAAQKLKRKWIGIDITCLAISLIEKRLKSAFPRLQFDVHGTPKDIESARDLARRDKYQFQWWAVSLVEAQPSQGKKKGADGGVDGIKFFRDLDKGIHKVVVSVKGGANLKADDVRSIMAVRETEKAEIALLISLETPTGGMLANAAKAGFYEGGNGKKYQRVQLLTIGDLLEKRAAAGHPDYEPDLNFKKAAEEDASGEQLVMEDV
jgi:site-specific DNA-methyltransferase (adenine-specific)